MNSSTRVTQLAGAWTDAVMAIEGALFLVAVLVLTFAQAVDTGDDLTRNTIRLSLAWYAGTLVLIMQLRPQEWGAETARGRVARWFWTWGLLCFLVHLAMAFHYYHHWSHADAFEHTRRFSGTGEGIYASYFFTWVWISDVGYWWIRPQQYATRSLWIDRALHSFMLFMVFNGMIVFESGLIRWAGLTMFVTLAAAWLLSRGVPRFPVT